MRGDFTRWTFNRTRHYSGVLNQQGRVALDADWNEQIAIDLDDDRTSRSDLVGLCGGPQGQAGFDIVIAGGVLSVTAGRYYVAGIRVENEQTVAITAQPDFPVRSLAEVAGLTASASLPAGSYFAYLDVWERHITALEEPALREVALGGPDTTTRLQVMAQVKLLRIGDPNPALDCATSPAGWAALLAGSSGRLEARAEPDPTVSDPCVVPADAGYRGLENQLYRVEVHRIVSPTRIALKWSRDNGSVVVGWTGQDALNPNRLTVSSTGRDDILGLAPNQWVELTDDDREKRGESGPLVKIVQIEGNVVTIDPAGQTILYSAFSRNPKMRRWDMPDGELVVTTGANAWTNLEQGVQIRLKPGTFRPGDYWFIPARVVTGTIEWPLDATGQPIPQLPHGIRHAYCKLALLDFDGNVWTKRSDCRRLFPPLTESIHFYGVGGDGQSVLPGEMLPQPLQVAVTNGQQPVNNARVRFRLAPQTAAGQLIAGSAAGTSIDVTTGQNGIYSCQWRPDPAVQSQRVEAFLVEIDGKPFVNSAGEPVLPRVFFNASLERRGRSGCCVTIGFDGDFPDLNAALKELLARGERRLLFCLRPGVHEVGGLRLDPSLTDRPFHLEIKGCGLATDLRLTAPLDLVGIDTVVLHNLAITVDFIPAPGTAALALTRCPHVIITDNFISGMTATGGVQDDRPGGSALLAIVDSDTVRLSNNTFTAAIPARTFPPLRDLFAKAELATLADLFADDQRIITPEWRELAQKVVEELIGLNIDQRQQRSRAVAAQVSERIGSLSFGEGLQLSKLIVALNNPQVNAATLFDILFDLRIAAVKSRPGTAIMLHQRRAFVAESIGLIADVLDEDDMILLEHNRIAGIISLYGMPAPGEQIANLAERLRSFDRQPNEPGGSRLQLSSALMGTIHLRSNHLVSLTIGAALLTTLQTLLDQETPVLSEDICARLLLDSNIIEGVFSITLSRNLIMQANTFTAMAAPRGRASSVNISAGAGVGSTIGTLGWCLADVATYLGNQGPGQGNLFDIARQSERVTNLQLQIR
jgi:hypothetical protein